LTPHRMSKGRIAQNTDNALTKAAELAVRKLNNYGESEDPTLVLVLLDADKDLPCVLGPTIQTALGGLYGSPATCVIAKNEYETWFVAAAESLRQYLILPDDFEPIVDPEAGGMGKGWIERHFRGIKYSETVDQPKLTARMDLALCRARSPSFDKLCRELEKFRT